MAILVINRGVFNSLGELRGKYLLLKYPKETGYFVSYSQEFCEFLTDVNMKINCPWAVNF